MTMEFKMEITDGKGRKFNSMSDALVSGFREAIDSTFADQKERPAGRYAKFISNGPR